MKTNPNLAAREHRYHKSKIVSWHSLASLAAIVAGFLLAGTAARGQVHSGSTGADGAFNPTTNTVVDMRDHPTGIYHYTAANLSEVPFTKS